MVYLLCYCLLSGKTMDEIGLQKIRTVADYQFGKGTGLGLFVIAGPFYRFSKKVSVGLNGGYLTGKSKIKYRITEYNWGACIFDDDLEWNMPVDLISATASIQFHF